MLVGRIHGEHHHLSIRALRAHLARCPDAVQIGHRDIHDQHIRAIGGHLAHRLAPGRGLANHPQIGMGLEQEPQAITHHGMVIGQEDLDRHRLPCHLFQEHRQVLPDLVVQIAGDLPPFQRLGRHQPAREFVQPLATIAHLPATSDIAQRRNFR